VRIVVENFNGRLKQKFQILKAAYEGTDFGLLERIVFICVLFTNVDLAHNPLSKDRLD
jgi:hypothetical protein